MTATLGSDQGELRVNLVAPRSRADALFRTALVATSSAVLVIIVGIVGFLMTHAWLAWRKVGPYHLVFGKVWSQSAHLYGMGGDLFGSFVIALIALIVAVPISLALALGINEYVPRRVRPPLTALVDLLAAVPSLIYGLWGRDFLSKHMVRTSIWFGHHAAAFPLFRLIPDVKTTNSEFDAGIVVAIMVLPLMTSVSREVMSQTPREDCEAALALGGTRWGMITDVIFPFSRNGIIGGAMLAFGRALGETIAVSLVLAGNDQFSTNILQGRGGSVSAVIATQFSGAGPVAQSALTVGALTLFAITLAVNIGARTVVARTASGR